MEDYKFSLGLHTYLLTDWTFCPHNVYESHIKLVPGFRFFFDEILVRGTFWSNGRFFVSFWRFLNPDNPNSQATSVFFRFPNRRFGNFYNSLFFFFLLLSQLKKLIYFGHLWSYHLRILFWGSGFHKPNQKKIKNAMLQWSKKFHSKLSNFLKFFLYSFS